MDMELPLSLVPSFPPNPSAFSLLIKIWRDIGANVELVNSKIFEKINNPASIRAFVVGHYRTRGQIADP